MAALTASTITGRSRSTSAADDRWLDQEIAVGDAVAHPPHLAPHVTEQRLPIIGAEPGQRLDPCRQTHADRVDRLLVGQVARP